MVRTAVNIRDDTFNRDKWTDAEGGVICPFEKECGRFGDVLTVTRLGDTSIAELYLESGREFARVVAEKDVEERVMIASRSEDSSNSEERIFKRIVNDILTLGCPDCKTSYFDFDGCLALSCPKCGCGFCALCNKDCDRNAHVHVRQECKLNPTSDVYGTKNNVDYATILLRYVKSVKYIFENCESSEVSSKVASRVLRELETMPRGGDDDFAKLRDISNGMSFISSDMRELEMDLPRKVLASNSGIAPTHPIAVVNVAAHPAAVVNFAADRSHLCRHDRGTRWRCSKRGTYYNKLYDVFVPLCGTHLMSSTGTKSISIARSSGAAGRIDHGPHWYAIIESRNPVRLIEGRPVVSELAFTASINIAGHLSEEAKEDTFVRARRKADDAGIIIID